MNLPNYITLVRIVLIPFFIDLMIYGYYQAALAVFIAACVTDALDGLIARVTNSITELGALLDPIADKLLILASFVTLVLMDMLPVWLVIIVVSRDVILILGSLVIYFQGHDVKAPLKPAQKADGGDGEAAEMYRVELGMCKDDLKELLRNMSPEASNKILEDNGIASLDSCTDLPRMKKALADAQFWAEKPRK